MRITLEQLLDARPELFGAYADAWDRGADEVDRHGDQLGSQVLDTVNEPSIWRGSAAFAAGGYCANLKLATHRAADKMRDVPIAARAAEREIGDAQYSATEAMSQAVGAGLTVGPDARITGPDGAPVPAEHQGLAQDLAGQLDRAITRAGDAAIAFRDALNQENQPISDATEISAELMAVEADANRAAELAALGPALRPQQQAELASLLSVNSDDATFSTRLHEQLGPSGAFQLYGDLAGIQNAGPQPPDPATAERLARIQAELGDSLATATDRRNEHHVDPRWQRDLEVAAAHRYNISGVPGYQPYGYQILGGLLQSGDYRPEFLNEVGDDILEFENGNPDVWAANQPTGAGLDNFDLSLNDGAGGSAGYDPVVDVFTALADDPVAAREFFNPGNPYVTGDFGHPGRIDYLTSRDYLPLPGDPGTGADQRFGQDALGNALEAATLHGPRDDTSAAIVAETIHRLGGPEEPTYDDTGRLISDGGGLNGAVPPPMQDSVARILGGYIADVNSSYSDPLTIPSSIGYGTEAGAYRVGEDGLANLAPSDLAGVLDAVATDPDNYRVVHDANTVYTALRTEELATLHADDPLQTRAGAIQHAQDLSARTFGALGEAREEAIRNGHVASGAAYDEQLQRGGTLAGIGTGAIVAASIANPIVGAVVGGTAGLAINEITNIIRQDNADELAAGAGDAAAGHNEGGYSHSQSLAIQAILDHQLYDPNRPPDLPPDISDWDGRDFERFSEWYSGDNRDTPDIIETDRPVPVDIVGSAGNGLDRGSGWQRDFR